MTHELVRTVRAALRDAADPAKAGPMQRYMKSAMPYRGIPMPAQRRLWRTLFPAHPLGSFGEWRSTALQLWQEAKYREERYAAVALTDLKVYAPYRTMAAMPLFEEMIVTGAWWDYVDALATHHLGDVLRAETRAGHGAAMRKLMIRWSRGPNLWKRRAAILCQIRFKGDTDLELLYACLEPNLVAPATARGRQSLTHDFFIRKAVGWALRQYAWVDPGAVRRYVAAHRTRLSPLSIREATRNIGRSTGSATG